MSRKAFEPTEAERKQVEAMSGFGVPQDDIALVIGIDKKTLTKHFRRELDTGAAKANARVSESLFKQAIGGNVAAAIFWTKARMGWREKVEAENKEGTTIIVKGGLPADA